MVQKRGSFVAHHFAHKSKINCVDYYDNKGEWHREMQSLFPEKNREVFNDEFGEKHFFDVLTDSNIIIEFQHSSISLDSFLRRNLYYWTYQNEKKFSKFLNTPKNIWVFDLSQKYIWITKKSYSSNRMREIYCEGIPKILDGYTYEFPYELWVEIPEIEDAIRKNVSCKFVNVTSIRGRHIYGRIHTKEEFVDYITSV